MKYGGICALYLNRKTGYIINYPREISRFNDSTKLDNYENEREGRGGGGGREMESVFGERCLVGLLFGSNETMTSLLINARQPG